MSRSRNRQLVTLQQVPQLRGEPALLQVPMTFLDRLLSEAIANPDEIKEFLKANRDASGDSQRSGFGAALIRLLQSTPRAEGAGSGWQVSPFPAKAFVVEDADTAHVPDVTYEVRGGDLVVVKAAHMKEIDPKVVKTAAPGVRGFVSWLRRQKGWMLTALLDAYAAIGRHQLRFLTTLDPMDRTPLPITSLPETLALRHSASTYHRLLNGRNVAVFSPGGSVILPVRVLLPPKADLVAYRLAKAMNAILAKEFRLGHALSDSTIAERLDGMAARRTIAKYRDVNGIPPHGGRQKAYEEDPARPFRIGTEIDELLSPRGEAGTAEYRAQHRREPS